MSEPITYDDDQRFKLTEALQRIGETNAALLGHLEAATIAARFTAEETEAALSVLSDWTDVPDPERKAG